MKDEFQADSKCEQDFVSGPGGKCWGVGQHGGKGEITPRYLDDLVPGLGPDGRSYNLKRQRRRATGGAHIGVECVGSGQLNRINDAEVPVS